MMPAIDGNFSGRLRGLRLPNSLSEKAGTPLAVFLPCAVWRVLKKNQYNMAFTAMGKELYLEKLANAILNHGDVE